MGKRHMSARSIVLLCLLALQLQLFASSAIACRHTVDANDQSAAACVHHLGATISGDVDPADAMLDCQKCVLGLFFGVCHQVASASPAHYGVFRSVEVETGPKHFYRFIPDRSGRPPILLHS